MGFVLFLDVVGVSQGDVSLYHRTKGLLDRTPKRLMFLHLGVKWDD